jgi:hypothetical protein
VQCRASDWVTTSHGLFFKQGDTLRKSNRKWNTFIVTELFFDTYISIFSTEKLELSFNFSNYHILVTNLFINSIRAALMWNIFGRLTK